MSKDEDSVTSLTSLCYVFPHTGKVFLDSRREALWFSLYQLPLDTKLSLALSSAPSLHVHTCIDKSPEPSPG